MSNMKNHFRFEKLSENPEFAIMKFGQWENNPAIDFDFATSIKAPYRFVLYLGGDPERVEELIREILSGQKTVLPIPRRINPASRSKDLVRIQNEKEYSDFIAGNSYAIVLMCNNDCGEFGQG